MRLPNRRDTLVAATLIAAIVGLAPITNPGCTRPLMVPDPETGELTPLTPEELQSIIEGVAAGAQVVTIATGQSWALPIIEILVRLSAVAVAFFYGRPAKAPRPQPLDWEPERDKPVDPNP